jgi:AraC-like DNA-binding protein
MIEMPDELTEMPTLARGDHDLLSEVLSHVRLSGAIFLRGEYSAPWALDSPEPDELISVVAPGAERLILFHIVRQGEAWISAKGERLDIEAGDLVVLPYADRHVMGSHADAMPLPIADLLPQPPWQDMPVCRFDGGGDCTSVVCAYLKCEDLLFNPFLRRLPPLFRVRPREGAAAELFQACISYALDESAQRRLGRNTMFSRLPELLFVEALRLYAEQIAAEDTGWLAALNDPVVSRALALLHREPAHRWTVEELARRSVTSRSVLDERFRRLLDRSPMRYLTEWRMQMATDLLRATSMKLAAVAEQTGYGSEEAFSRAFARHLGMSPARWREKALAVASPAL